jgi:hypothetical protein
MMHNSLVVSWVGSYVAGRAWALGFLIGIRDSGKMWNKMLIICEARARKLILIPPLGIQIIIAKMLLCCTCCVFTSKDS